MSSITALDESQREAARVAGFTFLFGMVIVILANYGINFRLIVPSSAVETARNIVAQETLFRINIAANLVYVGNVVIELAALYTVLKPVDRTLALAAAFCRLVFALMWSVSALGSLGALRLLGNAAYLPVFQADQLHTLARLQIAVGFDAYYVGLPFWGFASLVCSYLWLKSRYIPRALAGFGIVSSAWCVICAFAFIVFPRFEATVNAYWFDVPMTIFELSLGLWLVFKGLSSAGLAGPAKTRPEAST